MNFWKVFAAAGAILPLAQPGRGADLPGTSALEQPRQVAQDQKKSIQTDLKARIKSQISEETRICTREFSESLKDALEQAQEQQRKLLLEAKEALRDRRKL